MATPCGVCYSPCTPTESRFVVRDMPTAGGEGLHVVHAKCYTVRALCPAGQVHRNTPPAPEVGVGKPCGFCTGPILGGDDCVFYASCAHAWVHFQCVSLYDFARRPSCPLCPAAAGTATASDAAGHEEEGVYVADADLFSPAGAETTVVGGFCIDAVSATGARPRADEVFDLMENNAVGHLFRDSRLSMRMIEAAYAARRAVLDEPSYRTPVRELCYELGLDLAATPVVHHRSGAQTRTVLDALQTGRCHFGDLVKMGLTPAIALRTPDDARMLVQCILRADVIPRERLPWALTFEMLVRAGVPVAVFAETPRSYRDLVLVDFDMSVFVAAGGTASQLASMTRGISADIAQILPQFGLTPLMRDAISL